MLLQNFSDEKKSACISCEKFLKITSICLFGISSLDRPFAAILRLFSKVPIGDEPSAACMRKENCCSGVISQPF